jgi:8-oxo-dGTP pyrophosphatase MutT (NUDIX family)
MTALQGSAGLRALARLGLRAAYPSLRVYWLLTGTRIHGVQCVISRDDEVLLVRHTYGDRRRWELPGGAVKRHEQPRDAAVREVREELGIEIREWRSLGDVSVQVDRRRGTLCCFATHADGLEPQIDEVEIEELGWFRSDALPARRGLHVAKVVALAKGAAS